MNYKIAIKLKKGDVCDDYLNPTRTDLEVVKTLEKSDKIVIITLKDQEGNTFERNHYQVKFNRSGDERLIKTWEELAELEPSKTHRVEVDLKYGKGDIINLETGERDFYLSTHTFYGKKGGGTPDVLKDYGWNVMLDNWESTSS